MKKGMFDAAFGGPDSSGRAMKANRRPRVFVLSAVLATHLILALQLLAVRAGETRPTVPVDLAATPSSSTILLVDACRLPYEQSYRRGQTAAELDISNHRLKLSIALGSGAVPPSPSDVGRARYEAKLLGQQGVVAEVVSSSCVPPPCDEAAYADGYRNRMERALINKFGPDFRVRIQALVNRRFGEG